MVTLTFQPLPSRNHNLFLDENQGGEKRLNECDDSKGVRIDGDARILFRKHSAYLTIVPIDILPPYLSIYDKGSSQS